MQKKVDDNDDNDDNDDKDSNITRISTTSFYDLTHLIYPDMPTYPGEPQPEFQSFFKLGKDKANVTRLTMGSHTGTHVDAPKHFISTGDGVDKIHLDKFMGEAVILDMSKKSIAEGITDLDLDIYSKIVKSNDIVLFYTGTSDLWDKNENIRQNFTYLEHSAAEWIVSHQIKCIGIDSFSVEKYGFKDGLAHKTLLSNKIGIIEGLNVNIKQCLGKRMFLICLPLFLRDIDGSPARVVAFDIL
jgi:kynurenine formamidase